MKHPLRKICYLLTMVALPIFAVWVYKLWVLSRLEQHKHCIVAVPQYLWAYAEENGGNYPVSDRGWADALLKLSTPPGDDSWIPYFVGVDDHGELFKHALIDHSDIPEAKCTRIYVQGLNEKSSPNVAIVFDRYSVQGGDHGRTKPGQPMLREVAFVDGSHRNIKDADWPDFEKRQSELLRQEGFPAEKIEEIYGLTRTPHQ